MADGFYREVITAVSAQGFAFWKMGEGSHEKWRNAETGKVLLIPHNLDSRHTANGILNDAGLSKKY